MRPINIIYLLLPFLGISQLQPKDTLVDKLFVCYGKVDPELIKGYELVVIESEHYTSSEIEIFNKNNKKVVAYISLSEANEYVSFYRHIEPFTLGKNDIWNSHFINIKDKKAQEILLKVISRIKQKGIQGLFLDNLDNVSKWGKLHDQKDEFITFLNKIKKDNEELYLVQNAGLFITNELKKITDAIVVESVISAYDFKKKEYALRDVNTKKEMVKSLKLARKKTTRPIYVIEYAETAKMKKKILQESLKLGFSAFVAQIDLQSIPKFKM
ncbi:endo alpha-1,4 polygalactosaminidase [Maribacter sp.]|uniref:endo alpha-1,4 polygalactosaminidase n=1 Tax=Maribacter sp. TaxID=1897614 RepID=UPI0025C2195F|nr:endo alpha-1,4 polygalactosaminidase [Maribacter sp.]